MSRGENPRSKDQLARNMERLNILWEWRQPGKRDPLPKTSAHNARWRETAAANAAAAKNKKAKAEREAAAWLEQVKARKAARK